MGEDTRAIGVNSGQHVVDEVRRRLKAGEKRTDRHSRDWALEPNQRSGEIAEHARDRWADEACAENDSADGFGMIRGVSKRQGSTEGFCDKNQVAFSGELSCDVKMKARPSKAAVCGIGNYANRGIAGRCSDEGRK